MKRALTLLVVWTFLIAMLPIAHSQAQTRRRSATDPGQYRTSAAPGTPEYYNNDMVRYSAVAYVRVAHTEYMTIIGGSPQVPGGVKTLPLDDEEDVDNDQVRSIETRAANGKMYLGELGLTMLDGATKVRIRRKKATHKLLMILNCGNWAREIGVGLTERIEYREVECKPHAPVTSRSEGSEGFDMIETVSDGCTTTITKVRTEFETKTITKCVPDTWFVRIQDGQSQGKLTGQKSTIRSHITDARLMSLFEAQYPGISEMKVQFFQLLEEACVAEGSITHLRIVALVSSGGGWHWREFLIGLGVGLVVGFFLGRSSVDCPRITLPPPTVEKIDRTGQETGPGGIITQIGTRRRP